MNPLPRLLDTWLSGDAGLRVDGADVQKASLMGRVNAVGEQLRSLGVDSSSRVATYMDNSEEAIAVWFASALLGCLEVPLNTNYRGELLTFLLRDSGAQVVCCDAQHLATVLACVEGTDVRHVLVSDAAEEVLGRTMVHPLAPASGAADYGKLRSATSSGVVLYTSGTTGPSKGVHHSQESCVELARAVARLNGYGPGDALLNFFPLYHQNARYTGVAAALVAGCGFQLDRAFSSSRFWEICRAGGITAFNYLGSVLGMILKASQELSADQARDHAVRLAWGAGAQREVWARFEGRFGVAITEVYGLSEAPMATINRSSDPSPVGSVGREGDLFAVRVMRPDGQEAHPGEVGEICLRPKRPNIFMRGYLGREQDTVKATRDLWFWTGDSGWLNPDGDLFFSDRIKDAIRRKGENISAWEVESLLLAQPGVMDCTVYATRPDAAEEDEVMVALVLASGAGLDEVIARAAEDLPRYALPRYWRVLPALPRTPTHKVEKARLRAEGLTAGVVDRLTSNDSTTGE
ncbi:ATP-dependent acyl-CoA ligase [Acrocarpospora macrocephala]|uniref:ATP-dependent acyl-CoA ligase n=1 Tax=Acrocarpospora macrocephala TaxID=150177 RepID=A0A5M3WJ17_9ACTN|nr:AMP-binding protein [Acrocarpospora macrocephala]GES07023.1 ATP-dependent acyl-CoA ligase [Acrocarpospora macrocephala]